MALQNQNPQQYIYLADDDDDDRTMFAEALSEVDGSAVLVQATDGQELMDALYSGPHQLPDIIFLDINMPRKDGFECLEEIRSQDGYMGKLKIVILSTCNNPDTISKAFTLGANYYGVKPNSFIKLKELIQRALETDWELEFPNIQKFRLA